MKDLQLYNELATTICEIMNNVGFLPIDKRNGGLITVEEQTAKLHTQVLECGQNKSQRAAMLSYLCTNITEP